MYCYRNLTTSILEKNIHTEYIVKKQTFIELYSQYLGHLNKLNFQTSNMFIKLSKNGFQSYSAKTTHKLL